MVFKDPDEIRLRRHLLAGWAGLLLYLALGAVLEALHAFKAPAYLDVGQSTRRFLWTLAHAHGTLFSLIQIVAGLAGRAYPKMWAQGAGIIWWGILGGQVLMPTGFLLGGAWTVGGDAGPGVFLAPVGAGFLVAGVGVATWNVLWAPEGLVEVTQGPELPDRTGPEPPTPSAGPRRRARRGKG